ncbi:MAG: dihydrolipoyl dehydrogenase [Kiritimatiellae bacterium]|nr:dihydrolipoyl dehydrogenase [Kiritimatiellia bacterium]
MDEFDIVVIGAGPAGYPAAVRAAQLGKRVAVVEASEPGGVCLNEGCIPTKTLIASYRRYHEAVSHFADFGIECDPVPPALGTVVDRKDVIVSRLRGGIRMILQSHGVELIPGAASFAGPHEIHVTAPDGSGRTIRGDGILIATGSEPASLPFLPSSPRIRTSREFLNLRELPERMIVLGGGVIGCELACLAAQSEQTEVTVIEAQQDILGMLDPDVRRIVKRGMQHELRIELMTGKTVTAVAADAESVTVTVEGNALEAELLLVAVGRKPRTGGLQLENAGVVVNAHGAIPVNKYGQTNVPHICAAGDVVAGSRQLAHDATWHGVRAAEFLCGAFPEDGMESAVPSAIFTTPEVGSAGYTETQATEAGIEYGAAVFPFAASGKALAEQETDGFAKWIYDPVSHRVMGAAVVGAHATELISEATLAVTRGLRLEEITEVQHAHPTHGECWAEAAHVALGSCVNLPKRRGGNG